MCVSDKMHKTLIPPPANIANKGLHKKNQIGLFFQDLYNTYINKNKKYAF